MSVPSSEGFGYLLALGIRRRSYPRFGLPANGSAIYENFRQEWAGISSILSLPARSLLLGRIPPSHHLMDVPRELDAGDAAQLRQSISFTASTLDQG